MAISHFLSVLYLVHKIQPTLYHSLLLLQQMALHFLSHDANTNVPPAYHGTTVEPHHFGKQISHLSIFLLQASNIRTQWDVEAVSNLCLGQTEGGTWAWIWETIGIVTTMSIWGFFGCNLLAHTVLSCYTKSTLRTNEIPFAILYNHAPGQPCSFTEPTMPSHSFQVPDLGDISCHSSC